MRSNWINYIALSAITVFGALLRFWDLGRHSLWYDELNWLEWIQHSNFFDAIASVPPPHSPGFVAIMWPFQSTLDSDGWGRAIPAMLGTASVPAIYFLAKRISDVSVAGIAALLLAMCPIHVFLSRQIQTYPLVILGAILGAYFLFVAISNAGGRSWVLGGVCLGIAIYAHIFAVIGLGFLTLGLIVCLLSQRAWRPLSQITASWVLAGILYSPWLVYSILSHRLGSIPRDVIAPPADELTSTLGAFWSAVGQMWVGSIGAPSTITLYLQISIALLAAASIPLLRSKPIVWIPCATWAVGAYALWQFCMFWGYPPSGRYLISCIPAIILLLAAGAVQLWRLSSLQSLAQIPARILLGMAPIAVMLLWSLAVTADKYLGPPVEDWRGLCKTLARFVRPSDIIISTFDDQNARDMFKRYSPTLNQVLIGMHSESTDLHADLTLNNGDRVWYLIRSRTPNSVVDRISSSENYSIEFGNRQAKAICILAKRDLTPRDIEAFRFDILEAAFGNYPHEPEVILAQFGDLFSNGEAHDDEKSRWCYASAANSLAFRRFVNPTNYGVRIQRGEYLYRAADYEGAATEYEAAHRLALAMGQRKEWLVRALLSALVSAAERQEAAGVWPYAVRYYRRAYAVNKEPGWWMRAAGLRYRFEGAEQAMQEYAAIVSAHPDFGPARFHLGLCIWKLGEEAEGLSLIVAGADMANAPWMLETAGKYLAQVGDTLRSEEYYIRSIDADPARWQPYSMLRPLLALRGEYDKFEALIQRGIVVNPEPNMVRQYVEFLVERGRSDDAEKVIRSTMERNPEEQGLIDLFKTVSAVSPEREYPTADSSSEIE